MKTAALVISLLLVGFGTTACGSDSAADAPKDASVEDFCGALTGLDDATDDSKVADHLDDMLRVGTPADIPDDARKGFEFLIDKAAELDEKEDQLADRAAFESVFGKDSAVQFLALFSYYQTTCAGLPTQ